MKIIIALLIIAAIVFAVLAVRKAYRKPKKVTSNLGQATYRSSVTYAEPDKLPAPVRNEPRYNYSGSTYNKSVTPKNKPAKRKDNDTDESVEVANSDWYSESTY